MQLTKLKLATSASQVLSDRISSCDSSRRSMLSKAGQAKYFVGPCRNSCRAGDVYADRYTCRSLWRGFILVADNEECWRSTRVVYRRRFVWPERNAAAS
jgi:hypothetical protein